MQFLNKDDLNFLARGCFGSAPKVAKTEPMIRRQGNGNLTGFVRQTYEDGSVVNSEFIINAATREAVQAAYLNSGYAA